MNNQRVENIVNQAFQLAGDHKHQYVTLEHLSVALLDDADIRDLCENLSCDSTEIVKELSKYIEVNLTDIVTENSVKPKKTVTLERVFNRALAQAFFSSVISSRLLACICRRRPIRSFLPRTEFKTLSPDFRTPE